jgi:hypothetical protein
MARHGDSGLKFGPQQQCTRRFSMASVVRIERFLGEGDDSDDA